MATIRPEIGPNRTGIASDATSKKLSEEMVEATQEFPPNPDGDERYIAEVRAEVAREVDGVGSVPPPPTLKGIAKAAAQKLRAESPALFIDKLGERLVFERSGVRVYEALLSKLDAYGEFDGGPERADLVHILSEEYEHYRALEEALEDLGADPTALTPSANLTATMASGIVAVILDARTTLAQSLEALLLLELADNDCWESLVELARGAGQDRLVETFERALQAERDHLLNVREWIAAAQGRAN